MNKLQYALFLITLISFTSCGKGTDSPTSGSARADGTCTAVYVRDYNQVNDDLSLLKKLIKQNSSDNEIKSQILKINSSCEKFLNTHVAETKCIALVNNVEKEVNGTKLI